MKKIKVAVLMGGVSSEREISLISGRGVVKSLNNKKYQAVPVIVSKKGNFKLPGKIDVVFIAMHGVFGEDGKVQAVLEAMGVSYTGSGVLASALGMDKALFRKVLVSEGIKSPRYKVLRKGEENPMSFNKELGRLPYFVKPNSEGSSVGTTFVKRKKDLKKAITLAFKYDDAILVEEHLSGREFTCGVMGNKKPWALPVIEIVPLKGEFFDYKSKYEEKGAEEIVPARISKSLTKKIKDLSTQVYKLLGCRGFARVDFIVSAKGEPIVLEINTIPGLTPTSLIPKAAKAAGMTYSEFLDKVIQYAIK